MRKRRGLIRVVKHIETYRGNNAQYRSIKSRSSKSNNIANSFYYYNSER
jgi:hypothetical protein